MPTYFKIDELLLGGSVSFTNLQNVRTTPDIREIMEYPAGHPHPIYTANASVRPAISFTTREVAKVLANIPSGGLAVTNDSYLYHKLAQAAGIPDRTQATHRRYRMPQCLAYWTSISIPNNAPAEAQVMLQAQYDGSNLPLIPQTAVALTSAQTAPTLHGVGPVFINGTQLAAGSIQSVEASSGISLLQLGGDSELYDRFVGVERTNPRLTVQTTEIEAINTYGLGGTALDGSNGIIAYLRAFSEDGDRIATNVASHAALQGLSGLLRPETSGGSASGVMRDSLRANLTALNDTVLPLLQFTGQTIP